MFTTTYTSYSSLPNPTANITVNKSRVKNYGTNVYLKDGTQFEIELFNPRTNPILAKIKINGDYISNAGIILKPGQRVFLERFIDVDRKFKFETYGVENSAEVERAIAMNGMVSVEFYDESTISRFNTSGAWTNNIVYGGANSTLTLGGNWAPSITTSGGQHAYFSATSGTVNCSASVNESVSSTKETGRVEEGARSEQKLQNESGSFNYMSFYTEVIKILPASEKPVEVSEIRNYCSSCGTRIKKSSWKFCPSCGANLKD